MHLRWNAYAKYNCKCVEILCVGGMFVWGQIQSGAKIVEVWIWDELIGLMESVLNVGLCLLLRSWRINGMVCLKIDQIRVEGWALARLIDSRVAALVNVLFERAFLRAGGCWTKLLVIMISREQVQARRVWNFYSWNTDQVGVCGSSCV